MKYPELSISNLLYPKEDILKRILAKKIYPEMDNSEFWPPFFVFTIFEFFYHRRMKANISNSLKKRPQLGRFLNIKSVLVDFSKSLNFV